MVEDGNKLHNCSEIAGAAGVSVIGEGENIFFLAIYMYFPSPVTETPATLSSSETYYETFHIF